MGMQTFPAAQICIQYSQSSGRCSEQGIWGDCRAWLSVGEMGIIKEYRIVMPVTVQEYRVAQIYMTARTQAMEAEQVRPWRFPRTLLPARACASAP